MFCFGNVRALSCQENAEAADLVLSHHRGGGGQFADGSARGRLQKQQAHEASERTEQGR